MILVETSPGELIDKITVLEIKEDRITDPEKLANVQYALGKLWAVRDAELPESEELDHLTVELKKVNETLWNAVNIVHGCDPQRDSTTAFVKASVACQMLNNNRCIFKKRIDRLCGSAMTDEKSYPLKVGA